MILVYVVAGCLAWGGPDQCVRRELLACQARAEEIWRERRLPAVPACEPKWLSF